MSAYMLFICAAVALVGEPQGEDAKRDIEKLEGKWAMTAGEGDGQQIPEQVVKAISLVVKGDRFIIKGRPGTQEDEELTFKLDPTTKPRSIDLTATKGPVKGTTAKGIYVLEGNTLKICHAIPGKDRPKEFRTTRDSYFMLLVFERK